MVWHANTYFRYVSKLLTVFLPLYNISVYKQWKENSLTSLTLNSLICTNFKSCLFIVIELLLRKQNMYSRTKKAGVLFALFYMVSVNMCGEI